MDNNKTTRIIAFLSAATLAVGLSGCSFITDKIGEAAGEKIGEKIVEGATGTKVDIDEGGASLSIEDGEGSLSVQTGKFVDGWPSDLTYPADYSILTSSRSEEADKIMMVTLLSTSEPYDAVVGKIRTTYESHSQFSLREEPTEIDLGSTMTTTMYFEGSPYDLMFMISETDDVEIPTTVQYYVTIEK